MNKEILRKRLEYIGFSSPRAIFINLGGMPAYLRDLKLLKKQQEASKGEFPLGRNMPVLYDKDADAGVMRGDYFHQDLHVAKLIFRANPEKHVDIGSRIDGFVAHVASFREIEIFDIRSFKSTVSNIIFRQADLMQLPPDMLDYCDSISSLHAIEHFGLGRYGDPIDYYGYLKGLNSIKSILRPGGTFYFSVPIGKQRIEFNAHRIFSPDYLWNILKVDYDLISYSYVDDKGNFHENAELNGKLAENTFTVDYRWGCGIFELKKKSKNETNN
jgi:SAM-dependent methyltransferase